VLAVRWGMLTNMGCCCAAAAAAAAAAAPADALLSSPECRPFPIWSGEPAKSRERK